MLQDLYRRVKRRGTHPRRGWPAPSCQHEFAGRHLRRPTTGGNPDVRHRTTARGGVVRRVSLPLAIGRHPRPRASATAGLHRTDRPDQMSELASEAGRDGEVSNHAVGYRSTPRRTRGRAGHPDAPKRPRDEWREACAARPGRHQRARHRPPPSATRRVSSSKLPSRWSGAPRRSSNSATTCEPDLASGILRGLTSAGQHRGPRPGATRNVTDLRWWRGPPRPAAPG